MMEWLSMPVNASTHGGQIDQLMLYMHWLMAILFLGWGAFFIYTLVRFRRKRHEQADYHGVKSHASSYLEVAVVVVEFALLIGLAIPIWTRKVEAFPPSEEAFHVRVVAEQFAWNIHYPGADGVFTHHPAPVRQGRDPQPVPAADARQTGCHSWYGDPDLVRGDHAHARRRTVGDRLCTALRTGALPDARCIQDSRPGRIRGLDGGAGSRPTGVARGRAGV